MTSGLDDSESGAAAAGGLEWEAAEGAAPLGAVPAGIADVSLGDDGVADGRLSGDGVLDGAEGVDMVGDAELVLAGGGCAGREVVEADEAAGRSGELRNIRGTIRNARKSVAAAPIMKNFNELPETRGSGTRRGAAIDTLTLGKEETGTREGGCTAAFGETGDNGTERGSTFGSGAGLGEVDGAAAGEAEAFAAAAKGGSEETCGGS